jgi:hypothetical protein
MPKKVRTRSDKAAKPPANKPRPPWVLIAHRTERFLTDVSSLKELFSLVAPVLAEKDQQRQKELNDGATRLESVVEKIRKARGRKKDTHFYDLLQRANEVKQIALRLKRADSMFRSNSLSSLITCFENFEADLMRIILGAFPARLKSPDKTISYEEALKLGSSDEIKATLISAEIDRIMRQSQREQFKYLEALVNYKFRENLTEWHAFVEVSERRNIHTHCEGRVSKQYLEVCQAEKVPLDEKQALGTPWSASDPKYLLATQVLKERYSDAEKTFLRFNKNGPVPEHSCRDWPLFRDFRKTPEFKRAFKRVFGKDFDEVPASAVQPASPLAVVQPDFKAVPAEVSAPKLSKKAEARSGE